MRGLNSVAVAVFAIITLAVPPAPGQETSRFRLTHSNEQRHSHTANQGGRFSEGYAETFINSFRVVLPTQGCSCENGTTKGSRESLPQGLVLKLEAQTHTHVGAGALLGDEDDEREKRRTRTNAASAESHKDDDASEVLMKASASDPRLVAKLIVAGHEASQQGRHRDALTLLSLALRIDGFNQDALELSGVSLQHLGEVECARCFHQQSLRIDPSRPVARLNLGLLLLHTGRAEEAVAELADAVVLCLSANQVQPVLVHAALQGLGSAYSIMGEYEAALSVLATCLRLERRSRECLLTGAAVLSETGRDEKAIDMLSRALAASLPLRLDEDAVLACLLELSLAHASVGSWQPRERLRKTLEEALRIHVSKGTVPPKAVNAVLFLSLPGDLDLAVTRVLASDVLRLAAASPHVHTWGAHVHAGRTVPMPHEGIVVAYLSTDFGQTVMLSFMARALATHTQGRGIKVVCVSVDGAHHEGSEWRREVQEGVQQFIETGPKADDEVALLVNSLHTAVLVHLDGHNHGARLGVLARGPAPVQMAYRFCASVGADYIPTYAGDAVMIPPEFARTFFSEAMLYLPPSYLVNSLAHRFPAFPPPLEEGIPNVIDVRQAHHIPAGAFVYACFNRALKIDASTFAAWVAILKAVPNSVLWMVRFPPEAEAHLLKAASRLGLDPGRVVFSNMAKEDAFLDMALASDVFLDTPPCNAHTTATYSLWSGTPVLTLPGSRAVSRVAASLLVAAQAAHTFTFRSLDDYVAGGIAIAREGGTRFLEAVHMKRQSRLAARSDLRLFNTHAWVESMERGFRILWDMYDKGEQAMYQGESSSSSSLSSDMMAHSRVLPSHIIVGS